MVLRLQDKFSIAHSSCIFHLHTISWFAAISLHQTVLASAPLLAFDSMTDEHGTPNSLPRATGIHPSNSGPIVDNLSPSGPAQNAPGQRGDLAAGSNIVDPQIIIDAVYRRLDETVQAHGVAHRVSSDVFQGLIYSRAQGIVQHLDAVLQALLHSTVQEVVQDLESRELPRQISTRPPETPLSDEERRLIDAVVHSVPGIRSASSRQPAPRGVGEQALPHRPRPANTASGSGARQPAQKRKSPEPNRRSPSGEGSERRSTSLSTKTDSDFGRGTPYSQAAMGGAMPSSGGPSSRKMSNDAFSGAACGGHISNDASQGGYSGGTPRNFPSGRAPTMNVSPMGVPPAGGAPASGAVGVDPVRYGTAVDDPVVVSNS